MFQYIKLERLSKDKNSSSLCLFSSYEKMKCCEYGHRATLINTFTHMIMEKHNVRLHHLSKLKGSAVHFVLQENKDQCKQNTSAYTRNRYCHHVSDGASLELICLCLQLGGKNLTCCKINLVDVSK